MSRSGFARRLAGAALALALAGLAPGCPAEPAAPARIARANPLDGRARFAPEGSVRWFNLVPNRPLTSGDRVKVEEGRIELHAGSVALRMEAPGEIELRVVDRTSTRVQLRQGRLRLRVRRTPGPDETIEIGTPNLGFVVAQAGDFGVDLDRRGEATTIRLYAGAGTAYGVGGTRVLIDTRRTIRFRGRGLEREELGSAGAGDDFDAWVKDRELAEDRAMAARYLSREVVGYEQLDAYGRWRSDADHGAVWVPEAPGADWAPYRDGAWEWIAPWGWTWLGAEPWGFAPYHYGRWLKLDGRWSWLPGQFDDAPVYSPQRVEWVDDEDRGAPPADAVESGLRQSAGAAPPAAGEPGPPPADPVGGAIVPVPVGVPLAEHPRQVVVISGRHHDGRPFARPERHIPRRIEPHGRSADEPRSARRFQGPSVPAADITGFAPMRPALVPPRGPVSGRFDPPAPGRFGVPAGGSREALFRSRTSPGQPRAMPGPGDGRQAGSPGDPPVSLPRQRIAPPANPLRPTEIWRPR